MQVHRLESRSRIWSQTFKIQKQVQWALGNPDPQGILLLLFFIIIHL